MNSATIQAATIRYQQDLEAFRQRPWDDDLEAQLAHSKATLEVLYLEAIPTLPDTPHPGTSHQTVPEVPAADGWSGWWPSIPFAIAALATAAWTLIGRRGGSNHP